MIKTRRSSRFRLSACTVWLAAGTLLVSKLSIAAPVKVAFVGDQGVGEHAQAVLSLIANEGTDLLLIQGDLGYYDNTATAWEANLTNALGVDFPVLTVVGNHENYEWPTYQELIKRRVERASGLSCSGQIGVKAYCHFENIDIVQVSPGINEVQGVAADDDYPQFISSSFAQSSAPWRICSWHKNQNQMQTGRKSDATGWEVYDACLNVGAMIALAHEHAYSRTYLLSDFRNQVVVHRNSDMQLESGRSFAFVSGLGGHEIRAQVQGGDWWASIYTATQDATHGALFCTFAEQTANCYFKAIDGAVPDQFSLKSAVGMTPDLVAPEAAPPVEVPAQETADQAASIEPAPGVEDPDLSESSSGVLSFVESTELMPSPPPEQIDVPAVQVENLEPETQVERSVPTQQVDNSPLAVLTGQQPTLAGADPTAGSPAPSPVSLEADSVTGAGALSSWLYLLLMGQFCLRGLMRHASA